ncbi:MAG TPA: AMP-binding protein, partial [Candidatus Limnocylindria bacterium]|nr:AMP-binding protein [Candidatus Limnocylindria bacterium]
MDALAKVTAWRKEATDDPDGFWGRAAEELRWSKKWERVLDWEPPTFRWYRGGRSNLAYNCVDHQVASGRGGATALITENERGESRTFTYAELLADTKRISAALRGLGIQQGDRIAIYMPTSAEAIALMLGAIRIGAVIIVVFAGFGSGALGERVRLAGAKALFATDVTYRKGKDVPLKGIVDEAVAAAPTIEKVVVLRRTAADIPWTNGRDMEWREFLGGGAGQDDSHVELEANEPAYILATSGTTAKPKLAVHTHGGYQVYVYSMAKWMFGLKRSDVWWSTSDIGWVVGHSYIVFGPLLVGCATIAYEGAIDHPDAETFYKIVERHAVTGAFTSPTAVRLLMRYGNGPAKKHDLASLERVFCAGE